MKDWKTVGVNLPRSVAAIIAAAEGADPKKGGMPFALASIIGALPWIAVALFKELPRDEYDAFAKQARDNMQQAWQIIGAEDPSAAFDEAYEAAKRTLQ